MEKPGNIPANSSGPGPGHLTPCGNPAPAPQNPLVQEIPKPTKNNDLIFISAKSEDFAYAKEVYTFLKAKDYNVFFSQQTLPFVGNSDYRKENRPGSRQCETHDCRDQQKRICRSTVG